MVCELAPTPKPAPACSRVAGDAAASSWRASAALASRLMERLHRELDLDAILERNGYALVAVRGDMHDFSAPALRGPHPPHHDYHRAIDRARRTDRPGSKSPSGVLGNATYPNGFDALNTLKRSNADLARSGARAFQHIDSSAGHQST